MWSLDIAVEEGVKRRRLSPSLPAASSSTAASSSFSFSSSPPPTSLARDDIQRLPDELLRRVFTFLHPRRRISAEGVCRRWERLALEAWRGTRTLAMRDFRVADPRLRPLLADSPFPAGRTLVLKRQVVRSLWARAAAQLRCIDFSAAGTPGNRCSGPKFLHASITWELSRLEAPHLSALIFERVKVEPGSLAQALASIPGLRRLVLRDSFAENPGQDFSDAMAGLLQRSPRLTELRFTHTISTCRWLAELPRSLAILDLSRTRAPHFKLHLALDGTPGKFPNLHTLDLANVGMSSASLKLNLLVASAPNLRQLDLQYIYCDQLESAPSLASLASIVSLNFFHYDPGNLRPFVEALASRVAPCRGSLRQLFVNAESLEDEAVGLLGRLPRLERLCLGPTARIAAEVIQALAAAPSRPPELILANPRGRDRYFEDEEDEDDDQDDDN